MTVYTQFPKAFRSSNFWGQQKTSRKFSTKNIFDQQPLMGQTNEIGTDMNRILILGSSGSGKSTLARKLGQNLNLPVIHLDRYYWNPGWIPTQEADWQQRVSQLVQGPFWIMDGNYRTTLDLRIAAADTVIFLDLPPILCALRAIKRRFMYLHQDRPDISDGCREHLFDPKFPSFVNWILNYPKRARPDVLYRLSKLDSSKKIVWLRSPLEVDNFLQLPSTPNQRLVRNFFATQIADNAPMSKLSAD